MKNMLLEMSNRTNEVISIVVQLNDSQLSFDPPLVPITSQLSLEEMLIEWINSFINRGE
jgi:hypothetical protein